MDRLERSDVILHIEPWPLPHRHIGGMLRFATRAGGCRYLRITPCVHLPRDTAVALLGHELPHALEVADDPSVVSGIKFEALYHRIGDMCRHADLARAYDTSGAHAAERRIREEVRVSPVPGSRGGRFVTPPPEKVAAGFTLSLSFLHTGSSHSFATAGVPPPLQGGFMNRRSFLSGAAVAAAAIPFQALTARAHDPEHRGGVRRGHTAGYGPLFPTRDESTGLELLALPEGFRYLTFGWRGDLLDGGRVTPGAHDGMAAFAIGRGRVCLVRNHEVGRGTPFSGIAYDVQAGGGTVNLEFDAHRGEFIRAQESLSGTLRNCAGGPTPWGTWLTCEETTEFTTMPHGYVFEVPLDGSADAIPLRDMGRLSHEAVAVDPATGYIYETEDAGNASGFYRFVPNVPGNLGAGGALFMLKVQGTSLANLGASYAAGATFDVEWVPIPTPDSFSPTMPGNFVWAQGRAQGAATFARLEGCWYGNDAKVYIVSTSGGIGQGQIWEYDPRAETISLLFQSPGAQVLNAPDNITVSPRGGLVLCEDGSGEEFMHGLTTDGEIFPFAKNIVRLNGERNGIVGDFTGSEWAGACFSPDGRWLFANIQSPGVTVAIIGPWSAGGL